MQSIGPIGEDLEAPVWVRALVPHKPVTLGIETHLAVRARPTL